MARRGENIYKRRDGRYEGRYVIGRTANGRTRFGYIYGKQYQIVQTQLLLRKAEQLSHCADSCKCRLTIEKWMESWLENEQRALVKPSSYQTYRRIYLKHIKPALGKIPIGSLTPAFVQDFVADLLSKNLSVNTVKSIHRLLAAAMRSAQDEGLIRKNPCRKVRIQAADSSEQRVLNRSEQERLRKAALEKQDIPTLLGLYTGMRLGEICALRWSDIQWEDQTISIRRTVQRTACINTSPNKQKTMLSIGTPKSMQSRRILPIPDFILNLLRCRQADSHSAYIFGTSDKPAEPRTMQRRFHQLTDSIGIEQVHFHTLRHSFATRLVELGIDTKTISTLLGHSSTRITLDFYAHSLPDQQRTAIEQLVRLTATL